MAVDLIVDFNNERERAFLYSKMRGLRGKQRIEIKKYCRRRTDRQNSYYWPVFVQPFAEFLREQGYNVTNDDAHEILKMKFLRVVVEDQRAGKLEHTLSTTKLTTQEFNDYLDRCSQFLFEFFGIVTPEPAIYRLKVNSNDKA